MGNWDLIRQLPNEYGAWREDVAAGNTLLGFEEWLKPDLVAARRAGDEWLESQAAEGAAERETIEDVNIGATPTETLTFPDGTLVSVYIDPSERTTGAVVVLVDETRRAVRVTLNSNAEVRLWAVPAED